MTKKQLLEKLASFPDEMEVFIYQTIDEYGYSLAEDVEIRNVTFKAPEIPKEEWATVECIVISDEI